MKVDAFAVTREYGMKFHFHGRSGKNIPDAVPPLRNCWNILHPLGLMTSNHHTRNAMSDDKIDHVWKLMKKIGPLTRTKP